MFIHGRIISFFLFLGSICVEVWAQNLENLCTPLRTGGVEAVVLHDGAVNSASFSPDEKKS